jgi:hypothetical protein
MTARYGSISDEMILELVKQPGAYICTSQQDYSQDALKNQKAHIAKIAAEARDQHCCKTEQMAINFDKPPKSYKDAMSRPDAASVEWYKACLKVYSWDQVSRNDEHRPSPKRGQGLGFDHKERVQGQGGNS